MSSSVASPRRLPTVFVSHGGGPVPVLPAGMFPPTFAWMAKDGAASNSLVNLLKDLDVKKEELKAVLVISAHWEAPMTTVGNAAVNKVNYDYFGFPPEAYKIDYPAPGAPEIGGYALHLLKEAGIPCRADAFHPLDHGSFIPLKLILPEADVPVFQVSLLSRLHDIATHARVGAALAPLRDQGVLIVGSGFMTHNLGDIRAGIPSDAPIDPKYQAFTDYVSDVLTNPAHSLQDRANLLLSIPQKAPNFKLAHPREEHFMPLIVAACAAIPELGPALGSTPPKSSMVLGADGTMVSKQEPSAFKATKMFEAWGASTMAFVNFRFD